MAIGGTNTKAGKRKIVQRKKADPFLRKEWYTVKAPGHFKQPVVGQTVVTKTIGLKVASDSLQGRVFTVNLGDLNKGLDENTNGNRKILLRTEEIRDRECLTNFHGLDMTNHKYFSLFRKGYSFVDCNAEVTTQDGYVLRVFGIAFTERLRGQKTANVYAKTSVTRKIRNQMVSVINDKLSNDTMVNILGKFNTFAISKDLSAACNRVTKCKNVFIKKVKVIRHPKFDAAHLAAMHSSKNVSEEAAQDAGVAVAK